MQNRSLSRSLASGLAGATALSAIHETVRRMTSDAPRMDVYGRRAIAAGIRAIGKTPPSKPALQGIALLGDILFNTLYFALIGFSDRKASIARGAALGAAAGAGAVALGPLLRLGREPSRKTRATSAMTIAWYTLGGVASACVYRLLARLETSDSSRRSRQG